jgi:hypothetical protein
MLQMNSLQIIDDGLGPLQLGIFRFPDHPTVVAWTPSADQWAAINAVAGVKHFVVFGGALSGTYFTGAYWSDAKDFQIV